MLRGKTALRRGLARKATASGDSRRFRPSDFLHDLSSSAQFFVRRGGAWSATSSACARKAVEGEDHGAMTRLNQERGDGKILVVMALARTQGACVLASSLCHRLRATLPHAAAAAPELQRGVERERRINEADHAARRCPKAAIRDRSAASAESETAMADHANSPARPRRPRQSQARRWAERR